MEKNVCFLRTRERQKVQRPPMKEKVNAIPLLCLNLFISLSNSVFVKHGNIHPNAYKERNIFRRGCRHGNIVSCCLKLKTILDLHSFVSLYLWKNMDAYF
mmetsp:Transcript_25646/g.38495  ORF Transcript_25646/g.38495 Transcript_25646/m.38495 type:complete len:100 (+) Transcript_25646:513-812(+)